MKSKCLILAAILIATTCPTNTVHGGGSKKWISRPEDEHSRKTPLPDISAQNALLYDESIHLVLSLGNLIWKDWQISEPPFLIKTEQFDYLLNHPKPSLDFRKFKSKILKKEIYIRKNTDTIAFQASYPINGVGTVIMTEPAQDDDPYLWTLKAAHELFHLYQNGRNFASPFVDSFKDNNELNFPFDYNNKDFHSLQNLEGEIIFSFLQNSGFITSQLMSAKNIFNQIWSLQDTVLADRLFLVYKRHMEWYEGVARYTELRLAELAAFGTSFKPLEHFSLVYSDSNYQQIFNSYYSTSSMINPIRFVGKGVKGRVSFYYTGLGKALLLDRINPEWKTQYKNKDLDDLLVMENE